MRLRTGSVCCDASWDGICAGNARIRVVRIAAPPSLHSVGMEPAEKRNLRNLSLRLRNLPQRQHSGDSPDSGGPGLSLYGNLLDRSPAWIMRRVRCASGLVGRLASTSTQTRPTPRPPRPRPLKVTAGNWWGCGLWFRRRIHDPELRGRYHASEWFGSNSGISRLRERHRSRYLCGNRSEINLADELNLGTSTDSVTGRSLYPRHQFRRHLPVHPSRPRGWFTNQLLRGAG